ncbi:uncharacterized protein LOC143223247 [Tachypleus tridentatus]|uniref:uncharacterized protein LOC143223247 n=1 Tax=Tachypleus tridentatus TaxID=6853 RepID=UPI003FD1391C
MINVPVNTHTSQEIPDQNKIISMTSSEEEPVSKPISLDASTLKKGLLWQQRDKFFSRWKERYFVLTRDYLACFKKGAKVGMSEMGSFLYKINLVDIEGLQWADKKREGVIAVRLGQEGQLLLWSPTTLDDWMFALQEAIGSSKGRREVLRKSQSLTPQITDRKLTRSQLLILKHNLYDGVTSPSLLYRNRNPENGNIRPTSERQSTPHLGRRPQRISVTTDIELSDDLNTGLPFDSGVSAPCRAVFSPRLAPQCSSGSYTSLVSYVRSPAVRCHLEKPSPRSLQVSPALSQRSLYAQHILSVTATDTKIKNGGSAAATSEFSYIRSDVPVSSLSTRGSLGQLCQNSTNSEINNHENSLSCSKNVLAQLERLHILSPPGENSRPSSIYGLPSLTSEKSVFSTTPPDVVPVILDGHPGLKQPYKRSARQYQHTKSDSSFLLNKLSFGSKDQGNETLELI